MPEQMTKQDAIEYLLYMKHDVQAKSPMDIALDTAIEALKQPTIEPERKKGHINICNGHECCSECGKCLGIGYTNYCGYCGAELEVT